MKEIITPPGARRLITSLRDMGYSFSGAVSDLVDNSISAGATRIHVNIHALEGTTPPHVVVADNGSGMNRAELIEAMRFGTEREYGLQELGKYGLGLKTASLSQCEKLTVISRKMNAQKLRANKLNIVSWDLKRVQIKNTWNLSELSSKEMKSWEQEVTDHEALKNHGTVILWQGLEETHPWMNDCNHATRKKVLDEYHDDIKAHLRMVFHRFLNKRKGARKIGIFINGHKLSPWDPFALDETTKKLRKLEVFVINQQTGKRLPVVFTPYILPNQHEFSSHKSWHAASGPNGWNRQQGFYVYRNDRMIRAGSWSRLRRSDEHTKLLRVSIDFPSNLDKEFGVNITKMTAIIPQEIRETIRTKVSDWTGQARARYDRVEGGTSKKKISHQVGNSINGSVYKFGKLEFQLSQASKRLSVLQNHDGRNGLRFIVPLESEVSRLFLDKNIADNNLAKTALIYHAVLIALTEGLLKKNEVPLDDLTRKLLKHL
jgi:hypothetical protein